MGAFSQLSEKCMKCPEKEVCRKKRRELCAYIDDNCVSTNIASPSFQSAAAPVMREQTAICIGGERTMCYKDELERLINKQLREQLLLGCAFQSGA